MLKSGNPILSYFCQVNKSGLATGTKDSLWVNIFFREQLYYNKEHQQAVTCSHFAKIKAKLFAKSLEFERKPADPSQIFSLMLCQLNY